MCVAAHPCQPATSRDMTACVQGVSWSETKDHSKWSVRLTGTSQGDSLLTRSPLTHAHRAVAEHKPVVCIGGINRMESQAKRGGGTVCFEEQTLWTSLTKGITDVERCT